MIRLLLAILLLLPAVAGAQGFPSKPIKAIVPLAAGGTGDTLMRAVGEEMSKELAQPVVVENRPGAGGLIGAESVVNSPPDGYTLLAVSPAHVIIPSLYSRPTYDPVGGFEPITLIANTHQLIVAIALTSSKRSQNAPEIPTIGETVPGYAADIWYGVVAPAGTPKEVVATLNRAAAKAIGDASLRERLLKLDAEPVGNSPDEFRALIRREQTIWSKVVKDTGAKVE